MLGDEIFLFQLGAFVNQLEECLDRLNSNADKLAGDVFHHDALFRDPELGRLDEKIEEIIGAIKTLSSRYETE